MKILLIGSDKIGSEYGGGQVYAQSLVDGFLANKRGVRYMSIGFADITKPQRIWHDYQTIN